MAGFPPNRRQGHGRYGPGRCKKDNPRQRAEALPRTLEDTNQNKINRKEVFYDRKICRRAGRVFNVGIVCTCKCLSRCGGPKDSNWNLLEVVGFSTHNCSGEKGIL